MAFTVTPDKSLYNVGDTMRITVNYPPFPIDFQATAPNGEDAHATSFFGVAFKSTPARTWTRVSDNGSTAVFTAVL